jgi:16S rRNA (uracil1498-N3)-methyltransferase|tara:strand:- start:186456 stop:187172 length:717 start_codon:yes stop_codon:yes gene_type:complete
MSDIDVHKKRPRIFVNAPIDEGVDIALSPLQSHYFHNVMRQKNGALIRIFNGSDGEWCAAIGDLSKRSGVLKPTEQIKAQDAPQKDITLMFAPIKKNRLDFLIEKAVELGVSQFQPILTQNTEVRKLNTDRVQAQIIEATEQCERLNIPLLLPFCDLVTALRAHDNIYAAIERNEDAPHIQQITDSAKCALLIGPEGGFTAKEVEIISTQTAVHPVSLGPRILRAETAALYGLAYLNR